MPAAAECSWRWAAIRCSVYGCDRLDLDQEIGTSRKRWYGGHYVGRLPKKSPDAAVLAKWPAASCRFNNRDKTGGGANTTEEGRQRQFAPEDGLAEAGDILVRQRQ